MNPAKRFRSDNYTVHDVEKMEIEGPNPPIEPKPRTFLEVVSCSFADIYHQLSQEITDLTDFETLEINNVPTMRDAVNLISSDILHQKFYQTSYSIAIRLKIIDKVNTLSPLQYEIISTKIDKTRKFLLCLESLSDKRCCFYWKSAEEATLMSLSLVDVDVRDRDSMNCFVNSFLVLALRFGNDGLSPEAKLIPSSDLSLFSLADVNDKNLLMLASELGNRPVVEDLIRIGFDVNFQVENQIAADLAWENRHLDVLFSLLLENSLYPVDFDEANTSNEVKDFVRMTHHFMKSVKNNDEATVQQILEKYPNLRYFYSRDNVSAAFLALSKEKFNIYRIFMNKNVCVGPKEDIDKILSKFNDKKREELRQLHLEHSREPPEKFLMILHSNTSVGHDTINVNEKLNHAKLAIEYLCRISIIRLILQVVAASRDFKLIFDFNRDSVQFLDPTSSKQTRGSFFTSKQIYIAAKYLLDPQRRQEAIGTLAHELCHFAMFLVYRNNCLPYFNGDHKMAKKFHGYLKYCHENRKKEKIIGYVFEIPKENQEMRHAELIVRVPHLLALYHEDEEYLDTLKDWFSPLFSFFEFKVVEDMKVALPNIEVEGDGEIKKFNDKRKRKGFFRLRNIIIILLIASSAFIAIGVGIYFGVFSNNGDGPTGEVNLPWNAIVRHSRTNEVMCIGSLIHPEFVLTTAECVHKKRHQNPLPPELFVVEFHPLNNESFSVKVVEIDVYYGWQYNEDNFGSDISLLKLVSPQTFTENFHSVNLPTQIETNEPTEPSIPDEFTVITLRNPEVLLTINGQHSFNIPIEGINRTDCILRDYTINKFLGQNQYCVRQLDNQYCINGHGEQLYDNYDNTLYGLVSVGHRTLADCADYNSLVITDLSFYSDSIRSAICGERSNELTDWITSTKNFDFLAAVVAKSTEKFLCWSFFVFSRILVTDSNCIESIGLKNIQIYRNGIILEDIESIEINSEANIAKIVLAKEATLERGINILKFDQAWNTLKDVHVVYSYENNTNHTSRYYLYRNDFNQRVLSSYCIEFSGTPIFSYNDEISVYGMLIKKPCGDKCSIEDNEYIVTYVDLSDNIEWIFGDPPQTTSTTFISTTTRPTIKTSTTSNTTTPINTTSTFSSTTRLITFPSLPTLPPFPSLPPFPTLPSSLTVLASSVPPFSTAPTPEIYNLIEGTFAQQYFCNYLPACLNISVFSAVGFTIEDVDAQYHISTLSDEQVQGLESNVTNLSVKFLPINVVDVFPNLLTYIFSHTGVRVISSDNFKDLKHLLIITLRDNQIETIRPDTFNDTTNLRVLNLIDNKIAAFYEKILAPIQNLEVLWLGSNSLNNSVDILKFCSPMNFKYIMLANNGITEISSNILANCNALERIDFRSNYINSLNHDNFLNKPNLLSVDLTENACIDYKFIGSNETKFTTEDLNKMINDLRVCNGGRTTPMDTSTVMTPPP